MKYIFILLIGGAGIAILVFAVRHDPPNTEPRNEDSIQETGYEAVDNFGNLSIGIPYHKPGDIISHPYKNIPTSKFYIYIYQNDFSYEFTCIFEECGYQAGIISPLKGWLMGNKIFPSEELFGLKANKKAELPGNTTSVLITTNAESKIAGLYLNAKINNLTEILKLHTEFIDFSFLQGTNEIGRLKIGNSFPSALREQFDDVTNSANKSNFSVIMIWNKPPNRGCHYYECGAYIWHIEKLGGEYLDIGPNEKGSNVIRELGLNPSEVASNKISLMIVMDSAGKIAGLHPNNLLKDAIGILSQYPSLADISNLD